MAVQSHHFHALRKEWVLLVVFSPVLIWIYGEAQRNLHQLEKAGGEQMGSK